MEKSEAIAKWSELYGRQISESEYEEISQNLSEFFGLLEKWDKKDEKSSAMDKNT